MLTLGLAVAVSVPAAAVEPDAPERLISAREAVLIKIANRLHAGVSADSARTQFEKGDATDREGLAKFYAALSEHLPGEPKPLWVDGDGLTERARQAALEISRGGDWGLDPAEFDLPSAAISARDRFSARELVELEMKMSLAILKYVRYARGGRMDPTDLSLDIDRKPPLLPAHDVLRGAFEADDIAAFLRDQHPGHEQFVRLREAWLQLRDRERDEAEQDVDDRREKKRAGTPLSERLLYNMEMWRWMPRELGEVYVKANVPEFRIRVIKDNRIIHSERMITGKVENKTPIFSDQIEYFEFRPDWNIPASIKVKDVLPKVLRGQSVESQGYRVRWNGRDVDSSRIDWSTTDIRNVHIYQPPGRRNALGMVKFMFPNRHAVYFHDTPSKYLFDKKVRTFSHGCLRVRDPMKMAAVLLGQDKGWDRNDVDRVLDSGIDNRRIDLDRKIPVHITYFTAQINQDGELVLTDDIYNHESLVKLGFEGKAHTIVKEDRSLEKYLPDRVGAVASNARNSGFRRSRPWYESQAAPRRNSDRSWMRRVWGMDN